jgi:hypothetical protein
MLEQRWTNEGAGPALGDVRSDRTARLATPRGSSPRGGTAVDLRPANEPSRRDPRDLRQAPPSARRATAARGVEVSERDAICATALAAFQSSAQAPSVLDVDAVSLRPSRLKLRQERPAEAQWTPPPLLVEESFPLEASSSGSEAEQRHLRVRHRPRRNLVVGFVAVGLSSLLGGGLFFTLTEREDAALGAVAAQANVAVVPDPELLPADGLGDVDGVTPAEAHLAHVEGVFDLTEATFREGEGSVASTTFPAGRQVSLWLEFEYVQRDEADQLSVVWFNEATELARSDQALSAGPQRSAFLAPALDLPGAYRAEVLLNDQLLTTLPFEVTAP